MAKAVIYSDEDVLAAQQVLRSKTTRKVGKTRSQVAEFLAEAGISVSVAKMQAILERQETEGKTLSTGLLNKKTPGNAGAPISKN